MSKRGRTFSKKFKAKAVLEALKEKLRIRSTSEKIEIFTESNFGLDK